MVQQRSIVTRKSSPGGSGELSIISRLEQRVPEVIQSMTSMDAYSKHIQMMKEDRSAPLFPVPMVGKNFLPAIFLAEPSLLGAEDSSEALRPHGEMMKIIAQHVQIRSRDDDSMLLSELVQRGAPGTVAAGLKRVTDAFRDSTITGSEKFIGAFMDGILETQNRNGLLLDEDALKNSVTALAEMCDVQIPDRMSENLRRLLDSYVKKRDDNKSERLKKLRDTQDKISKARNEASKKMLSAINTFMLETEKVRNEELQVAMGLLSDELDFKEKVSEIVHLSTLPSHSLPNRVWMESLGLRSDSETITCCLTGRDLENVNKNELFVSEPLEGCVRVCLYQQLVVDILYRAMFGAPKSQKHRPGKIEFMHYGGVTDPSGLCIWKYAKHPYSRRPEDQYKATPIASQRDINRLLSHESVAPLWAFAQHFAMFECDKRGLPSEKVFSGLVSSIGPCLDSESCSKLLSGYDLLANRYHQLMKTRRIPSDFLDLYRETLRGDTTNWMKYKHTHPEFFEYTRALDSFIVSFLRPFQSRTIKLTNPDHV